MYQVGVHGLKTTQILDITMQGLIITDSQWKGFLVTIIGIIHKLVKEGGIRIKNIVFKFLSNHSGEKKHVYTF